MHDYHLYDEWINNEVEKAEVKARNEGVDFNRKNTCDCCNIIC